MNVQLHSNMNSPDLYKIVASIKRHDIRNRVLEHTYELIAQRLADKFVEEHGAELLKTIDTEELTKRVADLTEQQLIDEAKRNADSE